MTDIHHFLIVDSLFERYTIIVKPINGMTHVYCTECETWVNAYEGDQLTTQSESELMEQIVDDHKSDFGEIVLFDDTESFK